MRQTSPPKAKESTRGPGKLSRPMAPFLFRQLPAEAPHEIKELFNFWRKQKAFVGGEYRQLPTRSSFATELFDPIPGYVSVAVYAQDRDDVFVIDSGPNVRSVLGMDLTGKWFSECFAPKQLQIALRPYRAALHARRPTYSSSLIDMTYELSRLILPIEGENGEIVFVVAVCKETLRLAEQPLDFNASNRIERRFFMILGADDHI